MIRKLSEREHLLQRPAMYIGAVDLTRSNEYIFENDTVNYKEVQYVPGLIKIINEIIDNSVDVAIKTNFKSSNEISIKITNKTVEVKDNGTGIPVLKNEDGHYLPELCWNHARAGSNFEDDKNRTQLGMNGIGSYATACFSKKFVGETDDGKLSYKITITDNAEKFTESTSASSKQTGTKVIFEPDFERFNVTEIDEVHMNIIKQRLINLSMSFPEITFKFNSKKINVNSFKKYVSLFNDVSEIYETEDYKFAILPNEADDFRHFSYVNGLKIPDGGTHIDIIINNVVNNLKDKLTKKYKQIKPGDIRNKLMVIAFLKNVKNTKFNSQSKEKITNSNAEINEYYGNIDFEKISNKIFKTAAIIEPITEVYKLKEELKKRQELKGLNKTVKKIKSDKYYPSIGIKKYLFLVEGQSALGGTLPVLGRKECGYYCLKGVPLNAYSADQKKFTSNIELTELYKIIKNEEYTNIIFANDADLDGMHIAGLLLGFFHKYLPELKGNIGRLQTPVKFTSKNGKPKNWVYDLNEELKIDKGDVFSYMKGLGSWDIEDLKEIIRVEGLNKMIQFFDFDDDQILDNWLGNDSEPRKIAIMNNDFNIAKV